MQELQEREKLILESIICSYICTATPVGSRVLSKHSSLGVSPATIRNVMMDLEEAGLITQPHTSAGRIPTDKGYRIYVDNLMKCEKLTPHEKKKIRKHLESLFTNVEEVLQNTSYVLSQLSHQLSMVLYPRVEQSVVEKVDLISVSSDKILVLLTFKAGLIKNLILSMDTVIPSSQVEETSRILNERLSGLTVQEIQESIKNRFQDVQSGNPQLLKIIIDEVPKLFAHKDEDTLYYNGATLVTNQPEFEDRKNLETIIYLLEHKEMVANILQKRKSVEGITITIGDENQEEKIQSFSVITSSYHIGKYSGIIGIIGPKRMQYAKLVPLVHYTTEVIDEIIN